MFGSASNGQPLKLVEGSSAIVNMTASANPMPVKYEWTKEAPADPATGIATAGNAGVDLAALLKASGGRASVNDGVLNISNVQREDAGYYTVTASNTEGSSKTQIKIDVLYAPRYISTRINSKTRLVLPTEASKLQFYCLIDILFVTPFFAA